MNNENFKTWKMNLNNIIVRELTTLDALKNKGSKIVMPELNQIDRRLASQGEGYVLCAGPNCKLVKVGDKILFSPTVYSAVPTKYGESLVTMTETNVIAVIGNHTVLESEETYTND